MQQGAEGLRCHCLEDPRFNHSKICTATARYARERGACPRIWSPTTGSKTPPKAYAVCGPGFGERGKQEQKSNRRASRARTLARDSSRARAILPDATRSSVSAAAALVRALRPSPHLDLRLEISRCATSRTNTVTIKLKRHLGHDVSVTPLKVARAPATKLADLDDSTQPPP